MGPESDAIHHNAEIAARLAKIYDLHTKNMDFRLFREPHARLLEKLGNPHLHMPPIIHVAGTNGKGSTTAMLRAIYEQAGYKMHMYTSPHLILFNERVVIAGKQIEDAYLLELLKEIEEANDGGELTFKEFTCTLAMKAFMDNPADICLLEVGLGGRLDITNIIDDSALSVITQIGFDHEAILGNTIEKIAAEKAGIIKDNGKVVVSEQIHPEAFSTIAEIGHKKGAMVIEAPFDLAKDYETNLLGVVHQRYNMATAIKAVRALIDRFPVSDEAMKAGLKNVNWPARMQNISDSFNMVQGQEVWLDAGHNEAAAKAIAAQIKAWKQEDARPVHVILGLQSHKDCEGFFVPLEPVVDMVICVDNMLTFNPQTGEELARRLGNKAQSKNDYKEALDTLIEGEEPCRILILGSVFLAAEVLRDIS